MERFEEKLKASQALKEMYDEEHEILLRSLDEGKSFGLELLSKLGEENVISEIVLFFNTKIIPETISKIETTNFENTFIFADAILARIDGIVNLHSVNPNCNIKFLHQNRRARVSYADHFPHIENNGYRVSGHAFIFLSFLNSIYISNTSLKIIMLLFKIIYLYNGDFHSLSEIETGFKLALNKVSKSDKIIRDLDATVLVSILTYAIEGTKTNNRKNGTIKNYIEYLQTLNEDTKVKYQDLKLIFLLCLQRRKSWGGSDISKTGSRLFKYIKNNNIFGFNMLNTEKDFLLFLDINKDDLKSKNKNYRYSQRIENLNIRHYQNNFPTARKYTFENWLSK